MSPTDRKKEIGPDTDAPDISAGSLTPGSALTAGDSGGGRPKLSDAFTNYPVTDSKRSYQGLVWDIAKDKVQLGQDTQIVREYVQHPGAVGVLALDDDDRLLMLRQYRHPVRMALWELPAGLLDVDGEEPLVSAQRELFEEADLRADSWHVLVDWFHSPGGSDEAFRLFVARGLHEVPPAERYQRQEEERGIVFEWLSLPEAVDLVLAGKIHNPNAVTGILAGFAAARNSWRQLRPADSPWPEHPDRRPGALRRSFH